MEEVRDGIHAGHAFEAHESAAMQWLRFFYATKNSVDTKTKL
jgi:hypothetical protein